MAEALQHGPLAGLRPRPAGPVPASATQRPDGGRRGGLHDRRVVVAERREERRLVGRRLEDRVGNDHRDLLAGEQPAEPVLVEDRDAELLGLGQLRAGALAGDDVVGLLRDRTAGLAAGRADRLLGLLAG